MHLQKLNLHLNQYTLDNFTKYRARIITKWNDVRLNNHQRLQLQGWRANCGIQMVTDYHACLEYLTKYASKGESRSAVFKKALNTVMHNTSNTEPTKIMKKLMLKTLGERDFFAQETMHHLLSLKLYSSSFTVFQFSLGRYRRVKNYSEDAVTEESLLDKYAKRVHYFNNVPFIMDMNLTQFVTSYKVVGNKLKPWQKNSVPRNFPTFSSNPKGQKFGLFCKYQLIRYKPWVLEPSNAWDGLAPQDETFIAAWHGFLQTEYAEQHVPNWFDKLSDMDLYDQTHLNDQHETLPQNENLDREEWMILSDLRTPFETHFSAQNNDGYNWHINCCNYTAQQIGEMPSWSGRVKEQLPGTLTIHPSSQVDIDTFSPMQNKAYNIVKSHFENDYPEEPLYVIILGYGGTSKSYLISALGNLLQDCCGVEAPTGKASYNVKGVTLHSLLKLPIGSKGNKDLSGQMLLKLQESLNERPYLLIDEYSMFGQTKSGWIDRRCRQSTGLKDQVMSGKYVILTGDPRQLPPVADKPLYHSCPASEVGHLGWFVYSMFDKGVKLDVNHRVSGMDPCQSQFRSLLERLRQKMTGNDC